MTVNSFSSHLERKVAAWVRVHDLMNVGDQLVVAVSGGPDSVALLKILHALASSWNVNLVAVHVNHGLRGQESEEDARFVTQLCRGLGIDLVVKRLTLDDRIRKHKAMSVQEYTREERYRALYQVLEERGAHSIAVGHTADDQAETVLMWMIRGAGTTGLAGMHPRRDPGVIRPLLGVRRSEIISYLECCGLGYRMDSSNGKRMYLRNRIRQDLLPILKRFNPNIIEVLSRQANILREEEAFLDRQACEALTHVTRVTKGRELALNRILLRKYPRVIKRRVMRLALQQAMGVTKPPRFQSVTAVLDYVVEGRSGASLTAHGVMITREYESIVLQPSDQITERICAEGEEGLTVRVPSTIYWPLTGQTIDVESPKCAVGDFAKQSPWVCFDAATFSKDLVVRTWRNGDRFCPLRLGGKEKKLKDFFSDMKVGLSMRKKIPVLVASEGVLWIGGYEIDHRFRVTSSTQEVLAAQITPELT